MKKYGKYDVVVVGGGTSGVSAAISASRVGANTLLIERNGTLGGQMNVAGPPGFSYAHLFNARYEQIIGGIAEETHNRLLQEGHALPHLKPDFRAGYSFSYVDPDWWGLLIFRMIRENDVNLLLHTFTTDVVKDKDSDNVRGVIIENTSGRQIVEADVVIDCTGEGDIAVRAGAPYEKAPRDVLEPSTIAFTVDGVDWDEVLNYIKENTEDFHFSQLLHPYTDWTEESVRKRVKEIDDITELGEVMGFISFLEEASSKGEWHDQSGVGFFLMPREGGHVQAHFQHSTQVDNRDCTDADDYTYAEIECRHQLIIAWKFIKKYLPGFEDAYITRICNDLRIRETRRIMGDYKITKEDVAEARKFKDVIGKSAFSSGAKHVSTKNTLAINETVDPKNGGSHDIPYRTLVPKKIENLLVAGKAISTDRDSHHRFLQQTMVTGQAAGVAAALCARDGVTPRELENDVSELQKILTEQGAILEGTH